MQPEDEVAQPEFERPLRAFVWSRNVEDDNNWSQHMPEESAEEILAQPSMWGTCCHLK